ncbi:hypothetical protein PIB30_050884 [Stylosanthes scabra]|uniref:Putative plant transposon protein domain-containing protein n=1 Tax=Stylosanthes scabra TaxID=79078 RepID=A0ABU6VIL3_9FABA|nr:hypothetical protein [Stylosanthes scabra]
MHDDGRPYFLRRTDLQPMARGWFEFVTRSIMPTTNRSEVNAERAMLVHSIIIGEDIQVDEIIVEQIYKFSNKKGIRSKLPFPGVIQRLCNEAKASIPEDTMIPVETPINAKVMERVRGERTTTRQAPPPQEEEEDAEMPQAPQVQQGVPSNFMDSFNNAMELDTMDHQLNFLCNTNQFMNEDLLYPYQQTELTMRNMQGRGITVTLENLKINRQREKEMRIERQRYQRIIEEAAAQRAKEQNKGKARRDEDEDDDDDDEEDEDED